MNSSQQQQRRQQLHFLYKNGTTDVKTLSKLTNIHVTNVRKWIKRIRKTGTVDRKPGSGSPPSLTADDSRRLAQLAIKYPSLSNTRLAKLMAKKGSPPVSRHTIGRKLRGQGFLRLMPRIRPLLTDRHRAARLAWCRKYQDHNWSNTVFSDESKFQFYSNVRRLLCKSRPDKGKPKYGPSRMVWGAISLRGVTPLAIVTGSINSDRYISVLEEHLIPSPDLNIIENVWGWMKQELAMMGECEETEWDTRIINLWDNFPHHILESLFQSMPNRIKLCIENGGGYTKY